LGIPSDATQIRGESATFVPAKRYFDDRSGSEELAA
jgi:hypothetical protein